MNGDFLRRLRFGGLAGEEESGEREGRADEHEHAHADENAVALPEGQLILLVVIVRGGHRLLFERFGGEGDLGDAEFRADVEHIHDALVLRRAVAAHDDGKIGVLRSWPR